MKPPEIIPVLVVDDSQFVRRALREALERSGRYKVVGEATTGAEAVEAAERLKPWVITMDLDMPQMDGLAAIEQIMARAPTRILVLTSVPRFRGLDATFEALSRGALDLLPKSAAGAFAAEEEGRLLHQLDAIATVPVLPHTQALRRARQEARRQPPAVRLAASDIALVVMGASTGGPSTLAGILTELPSDLPAAVMVVQHLAGEFAPGFVEWLAGQCALKVCEANPGDSLAAGTVYVAARGPHVVVTPQRRIDVSAEQPRGGHCPSVDVLFESASRACGRQVVGVLLTGMGRDGAVGLKAIADAGGLTIAQDEASSRVFGMPKAAIELGAAKRVLAARDMPEAIVAATSVRAQVGGTS